jgi:hypothetical protein
LVSFAVVFEVIGIIMKCGSVSLYDQTSSDEEVNSADPRDLHLGTGMDATTFKPESQDAF